MKNEVLAYTLFRLFMGLNLFLHGSVRVGPNYRPFIESTQATFAGTLLPSWAVTVEAALIPGVELAIGTLLILGYKTRLTLIVSMGLMATLVFGMNLIQNWEVVSRHVVYVLAFYFLIHNLQYNEFSLDVRPRKT